jgi:hypothetical protein
MLMLRPLIQRIPKTRFDSDHTDNEDSHKHTVCQAQRRQRWGSTLISFVSVLLFSFVLRLHWPNPSMFDNSLECILPSALTAGEGDFELVVDLFLNPVKQVAARLVVSVLPRSSQ